MRKRAVSSIAYLVGDLRPCKRHRQKCRKKSIRESETGMSKGRCTQQNVNYTVFTTQNRRLSVWHNRQDVVQGEQKERSAFRGSGAPSSATLSARSPTASHQDLRHDPGWLAGSDDGPRNANVSAHTTRGERSRSLLEALTQRHVPHAGYGRLLREWVMPPTLEGRQRKHSRSVPCGSRFCHALSFCLYHLLPCPLDGGPG